MPAKLFCFILLCADLSLAEGIITTIAGGAKFQLTGVGGPAINVPLGTIQAVATDAQGNVYAADGSNFVVVKITRAGVLTVVAGNGTAGYSGDGGPATSASLVAPMALAIDGGGNIFVLDSGVTPDLMAGVCAVRKITPDGIISRIAGVGCSVQSKGFALDAGGNLYIADTGQVRKVTPQGTTSTIAGNGQCCYTGDGVPATSTALNNPYGVTVDRNGVIYIADTFNDRVRRVGTDGIITTIAGGNGRGYSGDGGLATAAQLNWPAAIALDGSGNIYVADMMNQRVRKITADGIIRTVAGAGTEGFGGDGGPGPAAALSSPSSVALDSSGNVFIADSNNSRIRKIDPLGTISTFAGNGNFNFAGDGGQARNAVLNRPSGVVVDASGNVYVSDTRNNRVRKIAANGVITTVAGRGGAGFAGDGGPGTEALLNEPGGLALDGAGNLYVADTRNNRVRRVSPDGIITTFAGGGTSTLGAGDSGPATGVSIGVFDIAFDSKGNLYIADGLGRIRRVLPDGTITTFFSRQVFNASAMAVDAVGNVYVSLNPLQFSTGSVVIRISPDGVTVSPLSVQVTLPGKLAFDGQGNIYIPDAYIGGHVLMMDPSGATKVIAGVAGQPGFSGDDGPAASAQLNGPSAMALDASGNLYVADTANNRIRKVFLNPASGLFEPKLRMTLPAGYYTATVALGQGEHAGYWGMEVLAPSGAFDGGLNLGGSLQQRSAPPGFGGFYLPSPQSAHIHVDARPADGGDASNVTLGIRLLDANKNPVAAERFGGTSVDFTQALPTGYYTIEARGGDNSPLENFLMSVQAPQLAGGVVVGGYAGAGTVGFSGFYLSTPQEVMIRVVGQPSYGADGAGGVRLTLYDANRNVVATVP